MAKIGKWVNTNRQFVLKQSTPPGSLQQRRELTSTNETPVEIACLQVDGGRMAHARSAGGLRGLL